MLKLVHASSTHTPPCRLRILSSRRYCSTTAETKHYPTLLLFLRFAAARCCGIRRVVSKVASTRQSTRAVRFGLARRWFCWENFTWWMQREPARSTFLAKIRSSVRGLANLLAAPLCAILCHTLALHVILVRCNSTLRQQAASSPSPYCARILTGAGYSKSYCCMFSMGLTLTTPLAQMVRRCTIRKCAPEELFSAKKTRPDYI